MLPLASDTKVNNHVRAQALFAVQALDKWLAKQKSGRLDGDQPAARGAIHITPVLIEEGRFRSPEKH